MTRGSAEHHHNNTTNNYLAMVAPLFLEERPLAEHVAGIRAQREKYVVTALWNISKGITMAQSTKVRVLAAAWGTGEREMAAVLLGYGDAFTVPVVLGAIQLLDSKRQAKQLNASTSDVLHVRQ